MSRRATLAAQLAQLHSTGPSFDPDAADHLDGLPTRRNGDTADDATDSVDRDHYLDVGPSRLRGAIGAERPLGERYEGKVRGRQKIFEDDDDESEAEQAELGPDGELEEQSEGDEEDDDEEKEEEEMGNDDADESSGDEEEDEEEEDDLDGDEEDDGEDGEDEEDQDEAVLNQSRPTASKLPSGAPKALDPVAALRDSRQKDVLKGQAIRRQRVSCFLRVPSDLRRRRDSKLNGLIGSFRIPPHYPHHLSESFDRLVKAAHTALRVECRSG